MPDANSKGAARVAGAGAAMAGAGSRFRRTSREERSFA